MSVLNAWKNGNVGVMYSDTAHVDCATGRLVGIGGKAFFAATWPAVVGGTFQGGVIDWLAEPFSENPPKNLKALTRLMPVACHHFCDRSRAAGATIQPYVRAVALAWCARTKRVRIFHCASEPEFTTPFTVAELDYFIGTGANLPETLAIASKLSEREHVETTEALELLEAQRRAPFESYLPGLSQCCMIGGSIDRLTVTREGVTVDMVHSWPDVLGERMRA
ncbi:hypothetical protein AAG614_03940 [Citromicrobium bathyomarinum]